MPVTTSNDVPVWRRRTTRSQLVIWFCWLVAVAVFMWCWQYISERTEWFFVYDAPRIASDIFSRATPPRWSYIDKLWKPLWDTVNFATLGTALSLIFAIPIAFLAAKNTTPSVTLVRPLALLIIVSSRSINSLIWALLLVAIIGPGILAVTVAIALR